MVRKASIPTVLLAAALSLLLSGCANEAGKSYEEGLRLIRHAESGIDKVEKKIRILNEGEES